MEDVSSGQAAGDNGTDITALLIDKLLDWPLLMFVVVVFLFWKFHGQMFDLLSSRQIEVEIGGQKLKIGDAVEKLDQETDITREDLDALQKQIDALKPGGETPPITEKTPREASVPETASADDDNALEQMKEALRSSKFTWRSIKRLALEAGLDEAKAHSILARNKRDITVGLGKSERLIARLKQG